MTNSPFPLAKGTGEFVMGQLSFWEMGTDPSDPFFKIVLCCQPNVSVKCLKDGAHPWVWGYSQYAELEIHRFWRGIHGAGYAAVVHFCGGWTNCGTTDIFTDVRPIPEIAGHD